MLRVVTALVAFCVCVGLTGCSDRIGCPEDPDYDAGLEMTQADLVRFSNSFGIRLFKELVSEQPDSNIIVSPLSVALALAMTTNGAAADTHDSMLSVLGFPDYSLKSANECFRALQGFLTNLDPKVEFDIANSVWCRQGFDLSAQFSDRCRTYFNAEVRNLDFDLPGAGDTINAWVSEKTRGRIETIVPHDIPGYVLMYLLDAIYFLGQWKDQFDPTYTRDGSFTTQGGTLVPCRLMRRPGPEAEFPQLNVSDFVYYSDDSLQIVDLPYGDSLFTMTILLPREWNGSIGWLIDRLSPPRWDQWARGLHTCRGELLLPRFQLRYEASLVQALSALGMGIAFGGGADLTGISGGFLPISDVRHKTFIRVNEQGTEAAAVTVVEIPIGNVPDCAQFRMHVRRPFLFVIRENAANTIIFIGKVVDPGLL